MHDLQKLLLERISSGLTRNSIKKPSDWACQYRVMGGDKPGKWSFDDHPWLKEMHDSDAEQNVGMKAAQLGFTETMLNLAFYTIDIEAKDCLYVLPSKTPDASDFSSARFDSALELSTHLANLFQDVKNVGHKRAGSSNLYVRGSQSRSGLKSIPVALLILDELEEMVQENIPLALERLSGQMRRKTWMISTPSIPNSGIHKYWQISSQELFVFKCPRCSRFIDLSFPESLVITAESITDPRLKETHLICKECKGVINHEDKSTIFRTGRYEPQFSNRDWRGFSVNQLYSTKIQPWKLGESYLKGQYNPADETEFFNSKLGKVHIIDGAKITETMIDDAIESRKMQEPTSNNKIRTMGIDVGKWLHWEIDEWEVVPSTDPHSTSKARVLRVGKVRTFDEIDAIIRENNVASVVIDIAPERRLAFELSMRFYGRVKLCVYGRGLTGKMIKINTSSNEPSINVDRTAWLDLALGRFKNKTIKLPIDIPLEYKVHIRAPVRVYGKDDSGNPIGSYVTSDSEEDHYAHARNYAEIAFSFAVGAGVVKDV